MLKIAVTTALFAECDQRPLRLLEEAGFEIALNKSGARLSAAELIGLCHGAAGMIAGTENLDKGVLDKLTRLKVISRCGAGMENVDLAEASRRGIRVLNTPDAPTIAVAELAVGLILSLLRNIPKADAKVKADLWQRPSGNLLYGKRVGIIGLGRIGRKVAQLLTSFGCKIAYADIAPLGNSGGYKNLALKDLLGWAEIITLHASGKTPILGPEEFKLMNKGAWLINLARGSLIDEQAVFEALNSGRLAGAAIDVFDQEPYRGRLRQLDNVILTPHIGSYTKETRVKMETEAAQNLIKALKEERK